MKLTRFEPWSLVDLLHRDIDRLAGRRLATGDDEHPVTDWVPAVDVLEETDRFVIRADVPGVDPASIDVSMDAGQLSISGARSDESRSDEDGVRRLERVTGRFYRRFALPDTADLDSVVAKSQNGILEISIPKQAATQARRITVNAA